MLEIRDRDYCPDLQEIDEYIKNPLFKQFCLEIKTKYKCPFIIFGVAGIVIDALRILPRQTYFWIFWGFSYLGYFIFGNVLYNIACKIRNGQHRLCLSLIVISVPDACLTFLEKVSITVPSEVMEVPFSGV